MKFSVQLPTDRVERGDEFTSAAAIAEMAARVENTGFDACWVTEHPFPTDEWMASGGHHALDPFVSLTAAAMATTTLRLHTNILVLPYRNPFLTAKAIASLDALSGGRVIMGVAAGYLEGEYAALGANFGERNDISDEALVAMKQAWRGDTVKLEGRSFHAEGNTMLPKPSQQPHPPIWVGGNSRRAIRRAAEHGQCWSPFPTPGKYASRARTAALESIDDLSAGIAYLREQTRLAGRSETLDVNFVPFGAGMHSSEPFDAVAFREQMSALESVGVTWVTVGVQGTTRAEYLEALTRFAEQVIQ